jgi:hypothetical protein
LRAVDEEVVPASAPATSRLFVLPVATRRWVLTDNTKAKLFNLRIPGLGVQHAPAEVKDNPLLIVMFLN